MHVLLIEDNLKMAAALKRGLQSQGYCVDVCSTGIDGEDLATVEPYDIILLDIMLPDRNGVDVCRNMRRRNVTAPILAVSALTSDEDRRDAMRAGADGYLAKPFEFEDLLRQIRELTDRAERMDSGVVVCDGVQLDLRTRQVKRQNRVCDLSERQCELLEYLMSNPRRAVSRREIIEKVWNLHVNGTSNVVDTYIAALRKKLDHGFESPLIHTVRGVGYRFSRATRSGDRDG